MSHSLSDRITIETDFGELPRIYCYPGELNQAFMNLLTNAVQAIENKGKIRIRTTCDKARVYVHITDTGRGIPPERIERLFEPVFSAMGKRVKAGMGLFTSYQIISKHSGELSVQSDIGPVRLSQFHCQSIFNR